MSTDFGFADGYGVEFTDLAEEAQKRSGDRLFLDNLANTLNETEPKQDGLAFVAANDSMYAYAYTIYPIVEDGARLWTKAELAEDLSKELYRFLGQWLKEAEIHAYVSKHLGAILEVF